MATVCTKPLSITIGALKPCWICQGGDPDFPPSPPLSDNGMRAKIVGYTDTMFPFIDRPATAGGPIWDGIFRWQDADNSQPWCRWSIPIAFVTINNQDAHVQLLWRWNWGVPKWNIVVAIQVVGLGYNFWDHSAADDGECVPTGLSFPTIEAGNNVLTPASVTLEAVSIL